MYSRGLLQMKPIRDTQIYISQLWPPEFPGPDEFWPKREGAMQSLYSKGCVCDTFIRPL